MILYLLIISCLPGCTNRQTGNTLQQEEQQEEQQKEQQEEQSEEDEITKDIQLYILLYTNLDTKKVFLESIETGKQEEFSYNGGTYVYNRYGSSSVMSQLEAGTAVQVTYTDKNLLTEIRETTEIFVYDDVSNFKIDTDKQIVMIADSKYYYDEALKVFSDTGLISINELKTGDSICIRGQGKEILTMSIKKGHGTVRLKNTEVFEGGMVTIGNVLAKEITADMVVEVPEGSYTLSVANDGYGGSKEIKISRFEELVIDLNELKGQGPEYCKMKITVMPAEAIVTLNGKEVDDSQLIELRYGSYRLSAKAEGYADWSKILVVSSKEAHITIELEAEQEDEDKDSKEDEKDEDEASKEDEKDEDKDSKEDEKDEDKSSKEDEKDKDEASKEDKK